MKNNAFKVIFALIIALTMLVSGCAVKIGIPQTDNTAPAAPEATSAVMPEDAVAYVTVDVNPSIEFTVAHGLVTEVTAFNDDGASIIVNTSVTGLTPEAAIAAIIAQLSTDGYLSSDKEASLVITVTGEAGYTLTKSLEAAAKQNIETLGADCDVIAANVSADVAQAAKGYGLSTGRYMMLSYIAEQERITIEEAITRYGGLSMEKVYEFVDETTEFQSRIDNWNKLIAGLSADQQAIVSTALQAYRETMRAAESAFNKAKKDAESAYKAGKDAAEAAFESDHDKDKFEQAKEALKQQFEQARKAAHKVFDDAKAAAKAQFVAAAAGLNLSDEVIDKLLHWDIDDFSLIGLTTGQQDIVAAALQVYADAMRAAERAFKQARKDAQTAYKAATDAAKSAYKTDHDKDKRKQAESDAKKAFEQAKKNARQAFKDAKNAAKEQFTAAVAGLNLSDKTIEKMLHWDFKIDFSYDIKDDQKKSRDGDKNDNEDKDHDEDRDGDHEGDHEGDEKEND